MDCLVRRDRLPAQSPLEGLSILRQAWDEFDIVVHMAARYKILAKAFVLFQLLLTFAIVCVSSIGNEVNEREADEASEQLSQVTFSLTIGAGFVLSLDTFVNAKSKWRQLRTYAGSLESMIWLYRCREAPFTMDTDNPDNHLAEIRFQECLIAWRDEMSAGANLHTSTLRRTYPPSVFHHGQRAPETSGPTKCCQAWRIRQAVSSCMARAFHHRNPKAAPGTKPDDHFSTVQAAAYIKLRLKPMAVWYQERIPSRSRSHFLLKVLMFLAATATSVCARYGYGTWVTVVAAFSSMVAAWSDIGDHARKVERYSRVVASVENLLTWWDGLSPIEKASATNISHLIQAGEAILSTERLAWQSTAGKKGSGGEGASQEEGDDAETEGPRGGGIPKGKRK